jgi:PAS domain S-box-containing protein
MYGLYLLYIITTSTAGAATAFLAAYSWRHRTAPGAVAFAWFTLFASGWAFAAAAGMASIAPRFLLQAKFTCIACLPVALLAFALQYTGRQGWLSPRSLGLLMVVPLITLALNWTNEAHGLFLQEYGLIQDGPFTLRNVGAIVRGPWFWIHTAYSYSLILMAILLLIQAALRSFYLYRSQAVATLIGAIVPLAASVIDTFQLSPVYVELVPLALTVSGVTFAWAFFRYRLLDVAPIARDTLIDSMDDGMLVLDAQNRIVDLNPAMLGMLGISTVYAIGRPAGEVLRPWQDLLERFRDQSNIQTEISLGRAGAQRYYDLRISPLNDQRGRLRGRLVVLRDITARVSAERTAQEALQREMQLAQNIQASLLPHSVPHIAGLELAGLSIPAREVGGDFYSFCQLAPAGHVGSGRWAIAVGDVTGKGIPAALYMAVSTILLSAKAPFISGVATLVQEMNAALYPYMAANRMNTALCYLHLDPGSPSATGCTVQIANAGSVAPILRRGAQCEYLEVGGLPLGATLAETAYVTLELALQAGDTLVMVTDGIVEAMNGASELYGFDRLLARVATAPLAAGEMLDWIMAGVRGFMGGTEQHDDMTAIVLRVTK